MFLILVFLLFKFLVRGTFQAPSQGFGGSKPIKKQDFNVVSPKVIPPLKKRYRFCFGIY